MESISQPRVSHQIATWGETVLGALSVLAPFLVISLPGPASDLKSALSILIVLILPIIGILVVVRSDNWDWFWTFFGLIALDFMIIMQAAFSKDIVAVSWLIWLLRAASTLLVVFFFYFLVKLQQRLTLRPPANFDILNLLLIALFFVQIFIFASFDEITTTFRLPPLLLCGGILALGVVVYLRTRRRWLQALSLLGTFILAMVLASAISGNYWGAHPISLGL
jgi:hypothetical protein